MTQKRRVDPIVMVAYTAVGGITFLSRKLGLSRTAVSQWHRVPAERVLQVEKITKVSRKRLRPDLYPPPKRRKAA